MIRDCRVRESIYQRMSILVIAVVTADGRSRETLEVMAKRAALVRLCEDTLNSRHSFL
jgi:hypothetical protein